MPAAALRAKEAAVNKNGQHAATDDEGLRQAAADALRRARDDLLDWAHAHKGPRQFADEVADIYQRFVGFGFPPERPWKDEPPEPVEPVAPKLTQQERPEQRQACDALRAAHRELGKWETAAGRPQPFANEVADVLRRYVGVAELQPEPAAGQTGGPRDSKQASHEEVTGHGHCRRR